MLRASNGQRLEITAKTSYHARTDSHPPHHKVLSKLSDFLMVRRLRNLALGISFEVGLLKLGVCGTLFQLLYETDFCKTKIFSIQVKVWNVLN